MARGELRGIVASGPLREAILGEVVQVTFEEARRACDRDDQWTNQLLISNAHRRPSHLHRAPRRHPFGGNLSGIASRTRKRTTLVSSREAGGDS